MPAGGIRLKPADASPQAPRSRLLALLALVVVLAVAGWFVWKGFFGKKSTPSATPINAIAAKSQGATNQTKAPSTTGLKTNDAVSATNVPPSATASNAPMTTPPVAGSTSPATSAVTAAITQPKPAVNFPRLNLQGIYLRGTNSSAIINGRSVPLRGAVDGVVVVAIDSKGVTVELDGQSKVLALP
jgi:cytoskeletal protein RodZ